MTVSGWILKARSTTHSQMNTGNAISTSMQAGFSALILPRSVSGSQIMHSASAIILLPNW